MILPDKYENLKENGLIIGSHIITILKNNPLSLQDIHNLLITNKKIELDLDRLTEILTFLFIAGIVEIDSNNLIGLSNEAE